MRPSALMTLAALLTACPSAATPPSTREAAADAAAGPRFDVAIEAPSRAARGDASTATIRVSPRAPWHVNLDYAPKLSMDSTVGVEFDAAVQRADQAQRFDADGLAFVLPFRVQDKGAKRIAGQLQFAMCAADACAPESVPVEFTVEGGCDTDAVC